MRRGSIFQLVLIGLVAGAIATAVAIFIPWLPPADAREAGRIHFVYWYVTVICLIIFAIVAAILTYAVINFRAKPGDLSDGPPIHGNTKLEVAWTVIPTVLVISIAVVSAIVLSQNGRAGKNPLVVKVYGVQFAWQFVYPNGQSWPSLHLPVNQSVKLRITSKDVIHGFWVPQFSQKQDAVPGQWNTIVVTPDKVGVYPVICTQLCGLGHALMRSEAIVQTQAQYAAWYKSMSSGSATTTTGGTTTTGTTTQPSGGGVAATAKSVFTSAGCAVCHTFKAIPSATGTIGPSLDKLKESAKAAGQPLEQYIRTSITDPNAYITPGYHPGLMPATFGTTLTKAQLDALVQYLAENTN